MNSGVCNENILIVDSKIDGGIKSSNVELSSREAKKIYVWVQNWMIEFTFGIICIDCNYERVEEE